MGKLFLYLILLFQILLPKGLKSETYLGEIKSVVPHESRFVNYGPIFLKDTLQIKFFVRNNGILPIRMNPNVPTFFLGLSPNDPTLTQWEIFRRISNQPELPKIFQASESDTIRINFLSGDTSVTKTGWHEALLGLSFLPGDIVSNEPISKIDTFFLRVKKTPYFVAGFEDDISFDSVYVEPNIVPQKIWRVKNVWKNSQFISAIERKLITQPFAESEILVPDLPVNPLEIYADSIIYYPINYNPINRGRDSLLLKFIYKPLPEEFPDSTDFAFTRISGVGVEQQLKLSSSNFNFRNDTIFIGNLKRGETKQIEIGLLNAGNLPFGIKNQQVVESENDNLHSDYRFIEKFLENGNHLLPDSLMNCKIEFTPSEFGFMSARIRIESDIFDRNILGVQPDKRYKYIYILGNVVSPRIVLQSEEIDFGNVILSNPNCPSERDTVIKIFNSGNSDLIIYSISTEPEYPNSNFYHSRDNIIVSPGMTDTLRVLFRVFNSVFDTYNSDLLLVTNQFAPFDSIRIKLTAKSVPPITANLKIPNNNKSKPGTIIEIPIILTSLEGSPSIFAKSFKTSLYYNRSLMEFYGIRTMGTASEGSVNYGDNVENSSMEELNLDIRSPLSNFFLNRDTLLFLKFKTYLGNSAATEISLIDPKFGDGKCDDILTLLVSAGAYYTDSVCGISYKAVPSLNGKFDLNVIVNSISSQYDIDVELPYSTNIHLKIIDIFGQNQLDLLNQTMPSGNYRFSGDLSSLNSGIYFVELSTSAIKIIKPLPITR